MAPPLDPIRGKIAKIINSRDLAINIGSEQGVEVNMLFDVLTPRGYDIADPDTGEILGSLDVPKTRVKIKRVYPKLSVASTYRSTRVNVGGSGLGFTYSSLFQPPKWVNQYETLKTNDTTWEGLEEVDSYVATGDPVVQVLSEDDPN